MKQEYEKNVFVNCPFDEEYRPFMNVILFTVWSCGYNPLLTTLNRESEKPRLNRIIEMIKKSKFGIHDMSRCVAKRKGDAFRMNMPFELGLDFGCKEFLKQDKKIVFLVEKKYEYHKSISDLSGNDPICYNKHLIDLSKEIRDWLYQNTEDKTTIPSAKDVWNTYEDFCGEIVSQCGENEIVKMDTQEFLDNIEKYITK